MAKKKMTVKFIYLYIGSSMICLRRAGVRRIVTAVEVPSRRNFFSLSNQPQSHRVSERINVSPQQIYNVVADVAKYHEFVPFCEESFINSRDECDQPTEAGLRVGWKQFDEQFTCKLQCTPNKLIIAESITILLFHNLNCHWEFKEVKNLGVINPMGCQIDLTLKYDFKNPLYNAVSSMFADQVSKIMLKAFQQRAMQQKLQKKFKDREINFKKS